MCQNIGRYLKESPRTVENAHKLAAIITRECSKLYLHHIDRAELLQFGEIYENSISDIVSNSAHQICASYLIVSFIR
jgi:hypothetical protein